jgi:hypothetical protein
MASNCPLCHSTNHYKYYASTSSHYLRCGECDLVFVPNQFHLSISEEKSRYDSHNNSPTDQKYRQFLKKTFDPLVGFIEKGSSGLDFGCGPGPTLSVMLEECGHEVDLYDKFYYPNSYIFNNKYDFITATEVIEHLDEPGKELTKLYGMLKDSGVLAVMTSMISGDTNFSTWYYKDDPTHICFYSRTTMDYLADKWQANVKFYGGDVALFFK